MHAEVLQWVSQSLNNWTRPSAGGLSVLEFGSLDINGSVRSILEPLSSEYIGVDMQAGPGVDVVGDAETYRPDGHQDIVVCCEAFEHTPRWREIIINSFEILRPGGLFVATMAGEGRSPHSAIDEKPIRSWEYYANVGAWELGRQMSMFKSHKIDYLGFDLRTYGIK